jgi:hypothetical protein
MLMLLRRGDIREFALSPAISGDNLLYQRVIESAFPRKTDPTAHYLLALVGEDLPVNCQELAAEGGAQVAVCN